MLQYTQCTIESLEMRWRLETRVLPKRPWKVDVQIGDGDKYRHCFHTNPTPLPHHEEKKLVGSYSLAKKKRTRIYTRSISFSKSS